VKLPPLTPGVLLRRYQRFLADVRLDSGETVTAHCANTGSMLGLKEPGYRVWLSRSDNPKRKLAWTWELVEPSPGVLSGIHTGRANALVQEALEAGLIPELAGYTALRREAPLGEAGSRSDLRLEFAAGPCHVEVKSVTAAVGEGVGYFPDAVSERAAKHLRELSARVAQGERAAVVFCAQRPDVDEVRPADAIDPTFSTALRHAAAAGVELYALGARVTSEEIVLERRLPVQLAR
jgi:sugar fermentation stimulation protein A